VIHVHGSQCTRESCPGADVYYHDGRPGGECIPRGGGPCEGHALPSRDELVAATLAKKGIKP
jgi:hypothetical protein